MKRTLIAAAGLALLAASGLAGAASWTVIVQPGVYGRVAIGGYAEPPQVYAPQPVVVVDNGYGQVVEETVDQAYATDQPPIYLWVPEYQRLHWAEYCREYGAYGVPVYFVDDGWYRANVLRRNWTAEQRSWNQQQWLEQDRLARDRFERQRFERQRYEQQQRWNNERVWHEPRQRQAEDQRAAQARWDHERAQPDAQSRMQGGSAQGYLAPPQPSNAAPRSQPGAGQWQASGGPGQQPAIGGHQAGYQAGNGGNAGPQQPSQPAAASQPHGAGRGLPGMGGQNAGDRRGDERGHERGERRGEADGRGAFERGHGGHRDR